MDLNSLLKLVPSWKKAIQEYSGDEASKVEKEKAKPLKIGPTTLYPLSVMWVDNGLDSVADVVGTWNAKKVFDNELSHADNMASTTLVYKKVDEAKPSYVLIAGSNADQDRVFILRHF